MKKLTGCQYEQKIRQGVAAENKNLETHMTGCPECRESQKVHDWMQKFKAQTPQPQTLPTPGFLLFKSRLVKKQSAAKRAVQPIVWAQIGSVGFAFAAIIYVQVETRLLLGEIFTETFNLLSSITLLFILSLAVGALVCLSFAYFIREMKGLKK